MRYVWGLYYVCSGTVNNGFLYLCTDCGSQGNSNAPYNGRQPPKKKRKSRTAFTNHQIFELEKRFLYQKYLSPADRDDIAQQLGLTNAQVNDHSFSHSIRQFLLVSNSYHHYHLLLTDYMDWITITYYASR